METQNYFGYNRRIMKRVMFGIMVMVAGALLLGFNIGIFPHQFKHIIFSWQMLLIAIGIINIFGKDSYIAGVVLISIGSFYLIPELVPNILDFSALFWPCLLFFIGAMMVFRGFNREKWDFKKKESRLDSGFIEETNIFSGGKVQVAPVEFKGGKITNIFGGAQIDLTQTTLSEGRSVLDIACIFGGVTLIVPSDWIIHVQVAAVFGGFGDKRSYIPRNGVASGKELYIKGAVIFGGGEVKSSI